MTGMTKGERTELGSLIRKRERVMKAQAVERSALLLAEFDAQAAKIYHYDDDEHWTKIMEDAKAAVAAAQEGIAKRCKELGIPDEYAPTIRAGWDGGGATLAAARKAELRRAARSRIAAMEKEAVTKIERLSLDAQTQVLSIGAGDALKTFLEKMPAMDSLMPPIEIGEMQSLIESKRQKSQYGYLSYDETLN